MGMMHVMGTNFISTRTFIRSMLPTIENAPLISARGRCVFERAMASIENLLGSSVRSEKMGMFRPAGVQFAPTPGHATVAPPLVRSGFVLASVNRAGDNGPLARVGGRLDFITFPGMLALRAGQGKTLHEVLRVYHILCVRAMNF